MDGITGIGGGVDESLKSNENDWILIAFGSASSSWSVSARGSFSGIGPILSADSGMVITESAVDIGEDTRDEFVLAVLLVLPFFDFVSDSSVLFTLPEVIKNVIEYNFLRKI